MKTNNNNEELLYSLPDYVSGKISNAELKLRLEEEIRSNADFKEEYELMKATLSSIKSLEFSEPPAHYFTNMVPIINKRIENQSKFTIAHIFRLANLMKYALPAVSVIVLIVIITFSNKSNVNKNMFVQSEDTISEIMKSEQDTLKLLNRTTENTATKEKELTENISENTSQQMSKEKNTKQTVKTVNEKSNTNNTYIETMFSETVQTEIFDDYVYETDFNSLSGKEQAELITKLSNTKF